MKKKILFLINDLSGGGAEKILVDIINNLDKNKYDITCKVLFHRGIYRERVSTHIKYEYFSPILIRGYSWISRILPAKLMYKLIIRENFDLEIAFLEGVCTKIISGSNKKKIAWIHTEFNSENLYRQGFLNINEVNRAYSKYNSIVSVSNNVRESFEYFSNLQAVVLNNPIKIELNTLPYTNFNENYFNIVAVGRLVPVKGFDRLLQSIFEVSQNYDLKLYIVGEGEEKKKLEKKILDLGLENTVELLGYRKDVLNLIKAADLLICSSYREGFSTVVGEAILLGTPVLTTDCSGMKELLLDGKLGLIVNNDIESITNGMLTLLAEPERLEKYISNIDKVKSNFTFEERLKNIEKLIDTQMEN